MAEGTIKGWGYEGKSLDNLLEHLREEDIDTVVDVRLTPISRKRGFSTSRLHAACTSVGVEYLHLHALGNPKDNRAGFADLGADGLEARERYRREVLAQSAAEQALSDLARRRDAGQRLLLLCFEDSQELCHRAEILRALPRDTAR